MGAGTSVQEGGERREVATQTEPAKAASRRTSGDYPKEILEFKPKEVKQMIALYREKQAAIDRSSIRGVQAKKDLYNSLNKTSENGTVNVARPKLDLSSLHRINHPKGYLTKITNDYAAQHDEELTVQKGTMVKVLRNHKDGRYEIYTAGGFGLVPGKILAYIQYEPDIS